MEATHARDKVEDKAVEILKKVSDEAGQRIDLGVLGFKVMGLGS